MFIFFYSSSFNLQVSHIRGRSRGEQDMSVKRSGNVKYFAYLLLMTKQNSFRYAEARESNNTSKKDNWQLIWNTFAKFYFYKHVQFHKSV